MDAPVEETRSTNEDDDHDDEREEEEDVSAWSWGAGTDGQLGTGAARDEHLPQPLSLNTLSSSSSSSPPLRVSRVACGGAHAVALTGDGRVLTWGRGIHGQLGHGELENCLQPKPVKFFESFTVCFVSAGWNHSGFVTGPSTWRATERAKLLDLLLGRIGFYLNQKKRGSFQQKASPINDVLEMNTALRTFNNLAMDKVWKNSK